MFVKLADEMVDGLDGCSPGRMCPARDAHRWGDSEGRERIEVLLPDGSKKEYPYADDRWEVISHAFVVVASCAGGGDLELGRVMTASEFDGERLLVDNHGWRRAEAFEVLDSSTVRPGMRVLDRSDSRWKIVARIDEDCYMSVADDPTTLRPPTDFSFSVADGSIEECRLLRCCMSYPDGEAPWVEHGKVYVEVARSQRDVVSVIDGKGDEREVPKSCFA